jgi:hypothetical protein
MARVRRTHPPAYSGPGALLLACSVTSEPSRAILALAGKRIRYLLA